jgi:hypothetical protein
MNTNNTISVDMTTNGDAFAKHVATNNEIRLDKVHSVDCVNEFLPTVMNVLSHH